MASQETPPNDPQPGGSPQNTSPKTTYAFIWFSTLIFLLVLWVQEGGQPPEQPLAYSEFKTAVQRGQVAEVTLRNDEIRGTFSDGGIAEFAHQEGPTRTHFNTLRPPVDDPELLGLLEQHTVTIRAAPSGNPWWQDFIISFLPWILFLALMFWFWGAAQKRMTSGAGGAMEYAKSRARRARKETSTTTLEDVAGIESAKREIGEIIDFLRNPEKYRRLGAVMPKGVLLVGPPGTGKTLLARAIAGEANVAFFSISASEFIEMFVGVGAARVRDMFQNARKEAPALIFIDELDAIGRSRGAGLGGGHDEREQTLNQILTEMDGFESHENVLVLAATNRPDVLDSALLRPGRFDRTITLDRPHRHAREAILQVHIRKVPLAKDVDLAELAARTTGFSGADLKNLVNEAALTAARENRDDVNAHCFEIARDRIVLGEERDTRLSAEEREVVAYHECGHALMAYYMPKADPLTKVTIIPHGMAMGVTEQTPQEDRYNYTESYLRDRIKVMLGGRSAEKIVYGEVSTGAQNDLKEATKLLRRMIGQWGMSDAIGPVGLAIGEEHVFLGREMGAPREHSEKLAELIDTEIQTQLLALERLTLDFLTEHRKELDLLAKTLMQRETLSAEEVDKAIKSAQARKIA
ncbi:MAG: ATP-dependent zinc metalloprotease FtsH [Marinobacter sp.]|nr:ATP-dependent zinc metalloprotease FtsH [Marinobacter sp.]